MNLASEYILNEYDELKPLNEKKNIVLVRNHVTGKIGVKKHLPEDMQHIYRFLKDHPNAHIPKIYELFLTENELIVIEEYVEGLTIEETFSQNMFTEKDTLMIAMQLCDALIPLHEAFPPIICRDITANNVMITSDQKVMLVDFNISRMVIPGKNQDTVLLGTQGYAAPEQFGFGQTDARTDIYALGVLMNFMLTGKHISEAMTDTTLHTVIQCCTKINPEDRYASVRKLRNALETCYVRNYGFPKNAAEDFNSKAQNTNRDSALKETISKAELPAWRTYLPPGFRTGKIWKMLVASVVYLLWTLVIKESVFYRADGSAYSQTEHLFIKISVWMMEIITIFAANNYLGIGDQLPLVRSKNLIVKSIGVILFNIIFFLIIIILLSVLGLE